MRPAVFLDKDGTLVEDVPYNVDPARIVLTMHAASAVQAFARAGYAIVVVTNQSGVARGYFDESVLDAVRDRLEALLGVRLDGFYACPHLGGCHCRKPEPGLIERAARDLDLDLSGSWMIGDILNDIEAGHRAGVQTVLIDNGNETEWIDGPLRRPHHRCVDLGDAALTILCGERRAA